MLIKHSIAYQQAESRFENAQKDADLLAEQVANIRTARIHLLERADKADRDVRQAEDEMRLALMNGKPVGDIPTRIASLTSEAAASRSMSERLNTQIIEAETQLRGRYASVENARKARDAAKFSDLARAWCEHLRDAMPVYDAMKEAAVSAGVSINEGMGWAVQRNVPQIGPFALTADEAKPAPLR